MVRGPTSRTRRTTIPLTHGKSTLTTSAGVLDTFGLNPGVATAGGSRNGTLRLSASRSGSETPRSPKIVSAVARTYGWVVNLRVDTCTSHEPQSCGEVPGRLAVTFHSCTWPCCCTLQFYA